MLKRNNLQSSTGQAAESNLELRVMLMAGGDTSTFETTRITDFDGRDINGYQVQNNAWGLRLVGLPTNTLETEISSAFDGDGARIEVTKNTTPTGRRGIPVGYPSIFQGDNGFVESRINPFSVEGSEEIGIPQADIKSLPIKFNSNGGEVPGVYNNTLDIWIGGTASSPDKFLMLQNFNSATADGEVSLETGEEGQPAGINPYAVADEFGIPFTDAFLEELSLRQSVEVPGLPGTYDIWADGPGNQDGVQTISYVRVDPGTEQTVDADLNALFIDARKRQFISEEDGNITNIYAGSEVWEDGVGTYNEFTMDVITRDPGDPNLLDSEVPFSDSPRLLPESIDPIAASRTQIDEERQTISDSRGDAGNNIVDVERNRTEIEQDRENVEGNRVNVAAQNDAQGGPSLEAVLENRDIVQQDRQRIAGEREQ